MVAGRHRQRAAAYQHVSIVAGVGGKINVAEFWRGSVRDRSYYSAYADKRVTVDATFNRERNHQWLGNELIDGVGWQHHNGRVQRPSAHS